MFTGRTIPSLSDVLSDGHRLIPFIPERFGFEWFLQNIAEIRRYQNKPWKNNQPEDITYGIWYWRLDEDHVMHRWRDTAQRNMTIFLAVLVRNEQELMQSRPDAVKYMEDYLKAVLESHNEPGSFVCRDEFLRNWRSHRFDFYRVRGTETKNSLVERGRVLKDAFTDLYQQYQGQYDNFMNTIIPGPPPDHELIVRRDEMGILPGKISARVDQLPIPDHQYQIYILRILDSEIGSSNELLHPGADVRLVIGMFPALDAVENVDARPILELLDRKFRSIRDTAL